MSAPRPDLHAVDLVHAGPVLHLPHRARAPRVATQRLVTPATVREIPPGAMREIGSLAIQATTRRHVLKEFEGGTWTALLGPLRGPPVRADNVLAHMRGEGVRIADHDVPSQLRWTPLHAWRKQMDVLPYRGDEEGPPATSRILDDARDEARAAASRFLSEDVLLCGGEAYLRVRGPFVAMVVAAASATECQYRPVIATDLEVGAGNALDTLLAHDAMEAHALATRQRLATSALDLGERSKSAVLVGASALPGDGPLDLGSLPGTDASADAVALGASWGMVQGLHLVDRVLAHAGDRLDDPRRVAELRAALEPWHMRAKVSAVPAPSRGAALDGLHELCAAVLQRLPDLAYRERQDRDALADQAAWLAADLLPRACGPLAGPDAQALSSLAP